jgi:transcriptional regulator with XRE-family HTH domain
MRHPNPRRITAALDAKGLYGPAVDTACLAREPAVDQWEAGTRIPTPAQLAALADLTGMTVEWFYGPDLPGGLTFICGRGRCQVIDTRPSAPVLPLRPAPSDGLW